MGSTSHLEINHSRMLLARPEKVFKAFRDQNLLKKWWGPKGLLILFMNLILQKVGFGNILCMALMAWTLKIRASL